MTLKEIQMKQDKSNIKFETAKAIRKLLDEARKQYGSTEWDDDGIEQEIQELVFEE